MPVDPSAQPTAGQALFGVAVWLALAVFFVTAMAGEPTGNRVFLVISAVVCVGFATWRSVWWARVVRQRR
ncbi:hypothetical protein [Nocardioides lijunqiniae]|uniref:hypothetical protein n=1 Tax=Nocardioides lijunqiniae TaxID=2760832 RepID=UPI0018778DA5|nr:hypothetical protein [Nocardioides lijunqiniae]